MLTETYFLYGSFCGLFYVSVGNIFSYLLAKYKNETKLRLKLDNKSLISIVKKIKEYNNNTTICFKLPYNYDIEEFIEYNYEIKKIRNIVIIFIF